MKLFDLHCDTLYECYTGDQYLLKNSLHIDLERGLEMEAWGQVFAVWMPDTLRGEAAFDQCKAVLEFAHRQAGMYQDKMLLVNTPEDLDAAFSSHRCAAVLTVEGGSAIAGDPGKLIDLKRLGVKLITLTWNGSNELGHGCMSGCKEGLTPAGKQAVREMERLGILPDVSHLNEAGFWDVAELTRKPFVASHSVSAAVHGHPRNLTDRQFAAIRDKGGLVGLNFCHDQLGEQSFDQVERHLYHYWELGGEHTAAFGADLDGTDLPESWGGIQVMKRLYEYLCRKNYEEDLLDKLFFGNSTDFMRRALTNWSSVE